MVVRLSGTQPQGPKHLETLENKTVDGTQNTVRVNRGATANRPAFPVVGEFYYNTDKQAFEQYTLAGWFNIAQAPSVPTSVTATDQGTGRPFNSGQALVAFTPNSNGGAPSSFIITPSPATSPTTFTVTSSPATITGLASSTQYTYTATAVGSYGTSSISSASSGVTATTVPQAPTITASLDTVTTARLAITAGATGGSAITGYSITSNPATTTQSTSSSPYTFTGLTTGTSYTFSVTATNSNGVSSSGVSNSIIVSSPEIPLLGVWNTGSATPQADAGAYWGWNTVSGTPRVYFAGPNRGTEVYRSDGYDGAWTVTNSHPQGGLLGPSSRTKTNSNRFYTYGADTGNQTLAYSTADGSTWRSESSNSYSAGWGTGSFFVGQGGNNYLISAGDYPSGTPASISVVQPNGTLSFNSYTSYPVYKAAGIAERLTDKVIFMGGYTSGLAGVQSTVYSTNGSGTWVAETNMPYSAGIPNSTQITKGQYSRVYLFNGATAYSRGDSSGTWRAETNLSGSTASGWGIVYDNGTAYIRLSNGQYQLIS
jgi:hypothetical protein